MAVFPRSVGTHPSDILHRIQEYSLRQPTYDSDSFKAFQGIFEEFTRIKDPVLSRLGVPIFTRNCYNGDPSDFVLRCTSQRSISNTQRLFHGLSWIMPTRPKRRAGFPTWTWVGWNFYKQPRCPINDDKKHQFPMLDDPTGYDTTWNAPNIPKPDSVCLQFLNGKCILWESNHDEVWERLSLGWTAQFLFLYGATFEVQYSDGEFMPGQGEYPLDVCCESVDWQNRFGNKDEEVRLKEVLLTCGRPN